MSVHVDVLKKEVLLYIKQVYRLKFNDAITMKGLLETIYGQATNMNSQETEESFGSAEFHTPRCLFNAQEFFSTATKQAPK